MRIRDLETAPSRRMQVKLHLLIPLPISDLSSRRQSIMPIQRMWILPLQKVNPNRRQDLNNNMNSCNRRQFMVHPASKRHLVLLIQITNIYRILRVLLLHH
jgi:hypothetical protein